MRSGSCYGRCSLLSEALFVLVWLRTAQKTVLSCGGRHGRSHNLPRAPERAGLLVLRGGRTLPDFQAFPGAQFPIAAFSLVTLASVLPRLVLDVQGHLPHLPWKGASSSFLYFDYFKRFPIITVRKSAPEAKILLLSWPLRASVLLSDEAGRLHLSSVAGTRESPGGGACEISPQVSLTGPRVDFIIQPFVFLSLYC